MDYPNIYEKNVIVNSRDVDGAGHCRASALLAYLQDASAEHSALCGCDRKRLVERYHVFWMLTRIKVHLERPICWLDHLTIRTGHRGAKGILLYRDYELLVDSTLVGDACALWVLPDLNTRKLLNTSTTPIPELAASAGGLTPRIRHLTALHPPADLPLMEARLMRYSDTDVNGHVNNTKYADFACDALNMEGLSQEQYLGGLEITYHEECMPGETLLLSGGGAGEAMFVHGAGAEGSSRFDARLTFYTKKTIRK